MAGMRFTLDLFIPEGVYNALPTAQKTAIRDRIRELKAKATKLSNENTVRATWHRCTHDEDPTSPCVEHDI